MINGQHVVKVGRLPGLLDLWEYVNRQMEELVEARNPMLEAFCKANQIVNISMEWLTLGLKFSREVKVLRELDERNKFWLEQYLRAVLEYKEFHPYQEGGGYVYYKLKVPNSEDLARIYPEYRDLQYWWDGTNWIAWD